jgi:hypothetical protein
LVFISELGAFCERRVEDHRIGPRDEEPRWVALLITLDLGARRIRRVFGIADGTQRRAIEERAVVEMQEKHGGVGGRVVDLLECRQAPLGELELVPAADHTHPLWRGRARDLSLQHPQGIDEGGHAVPAQLHVVIEPPADHVQVRVVETRDHRALVEIDKARARSAIRHDVSLGTHREKPAVLDRDRRRVRLAGIQGLHPAVEEDQIGVVTTSRLRAHRVHRACPSKQVRTRRCCALQEFPPRDAGCDLRVGLRFQHSVVTAVRHGKIQFVIEASCSQFCSVVRPTMPAGQSPARILLDPAAGSHQGPLPRYRGQVGQVDHPVHEAAVDSFPPGDFSQRLYLVYSPEQ